MSSILMLEQALNGLQFGLMLFLLASGLTLVFGIMDMINLAHGALYMVGAFLTAWLVQLTQSFLLGVVLAVLLTAVVGMVLEATLLRTLYARDHLSQVLATFALILIINESVRMIWVLTLLCLHRKRCQDLFSCFLACHTPAIDWSSLLWAWPLLCCCLCW